MSEKRFHTKGFISILSALSFIFMTISGVVLYIVPPGRIAYWTNWELLALTKEGWIDMHVLTSLLFMIGVVYHIYLNWSIFTAYIIKKTERVLSLKKELAIASVLTAVFVVASVYPIPPLSYVLTLGSYFKDSWVKSKEYEPPFGHAEGLSLKVFAKKMNIDLNPAMEELKGKGIVVENETDSLQKIAKRNKTNAMNLYAMIKKFEQKEIETGIVYTPELVDEKFAGTGVGRKTLAQICEENNIDLTLAKKKLSEEGITAKEGETMKEIASRYDKLPMDILKIILVQRNNKGGEKK